MEVGEVREEYSLLLLMFREDEVELDRDMVLAFELDLLSDGNLSESGEPRS